MRQDNEVLPPNIQGLIKHLQEFNAVPMGEMHSMPFIALRLRDEDEDILDNPISVEFKPSFFNVEYNDKIIAICVAQFKLNGDDQHIYTFAYNLKNEAQYNDAFSLLKMDQYGLFLASSANHDFLAYKLEFGGDFNPQDVLKGTRDNASEYFEEEFAVVSAMLIHAKMTPRELWDKLEKLTPLENSWYALLKGEEV